MSFFDNFKRNKTVPLISRAPKHQQTVRNAFQASMVSRLTNNWYRPLLSANKELQYDVLRLRSISRYLANNDVYASRYLDLMQTNIVGPHGITLQCQVGTHEGKPNEAINNAIHHAWKDWGKAASLDKNMTFVELEQLAIRTIAMDGEIFFRLVKGTVGSDNMPLNPYGFSLLPIDPDLLNVQYTDRFAPTGNVIVQGVEQTLQGIPVAYWFWSRNPNDVATTLPLNLVRVPAEEVIHIWRIRRPGQQRGLPWITPAMFSMAKLHEYIDAEIVAAQMAASTIATIESPLDDPTQFMAQDEGFQPEHLNIEAGVALRLSPGEKFQAFNSQHPVNAFRPFVETMLMGISSALNVSYSSLTSDPSKDNYASGRLGAIEQRDYYRNLQLWFIRSFHEKVYRIWLECALENKMIDLPTNNPDDYQEVTFRPRGWSWADPKKDADGVELLVALNMKSKTQLCAEQGLDYRQVVKERYEEEQLERQLEQDLIDMGLPSTLSTVNTTPIRQTITEKIDGGTVSSTDGSNLENDQSLVGNDDSTDTENAQQENTDGEQEDN